MPHEDILKFILEEKEISSYKISLLKKKRSNHNNRLIAGESTFINFKFEDLSLASISEARTALAMFRSSKDDFYLRYPCADRGVVEKNVSEIPWESRLPIIERKIKFLDNLYLYLLEIQLQEINSVQDPYFYQQILDKNKKKNLDIKSLDIKGLLRLESAYTSKCRARAQAVTYSMARYVFVKMREFKINFEEITVDNSQLSEAYLDNIILNMGSESYSYYNEGLDELSVLISGTMGENVHVESVAKLSNLCSDFQDFKFIIRRILPCSDNIFDPKTLKPIRKLASARAYALMTPLRRVGNEYIKLMAKKIVLKDGKDVTSDLESDFFNFNTSSGYVKAIPCVPPWSAHPGEVFRLMAGGVDTSGDGFRALLNEGSETEICIDSLNSKILVPTTRSESLHLIRIETWKDDVIQKINDEYKCANKMPTNDRARRIRCRRSLIRELLGSST